MQKHERRSRKCSIKTADERQAARDGAKGACGRIGKKSGRDSRIDNFVIRHGKRRRAAAGEKEERNSISVFLSRSVEGSPPSSSLLHRLAHLFSPFFASAGGPENSF